MLPQHLTTEIILRGCDIKPACRVNTLQLYYTAPVIIYHSSTDKSIGAAQHFGQYVLDADKFQVAIPFTARLCVICCAYNGDVLYVVIKLELVI